MIFMGIPFTWHIILLIPIFISLFLFTFSICTYLTHLGVFIEDLSNVINIILKLLFYFTGVFYSIKTKFPEPYGKIVLRGYPVAKLIDYTREVLLYANNINFLYLLALTGISIILSIIGIYIIYKNENTYVKMI
jgi:ABC-type polysaccharide/polyol phosphate export systems, permease component